MEKLKWQFEICKINKYHEKGYKGQGVTVLCHEDSPHGRQAMGVLKAVAPEVKVIYASVTEKSVGGKLTESSWKISGEKYSFKEVMEKFRPDIISCSLRGVIKSEEREKSIQPYIDDGSLIMVTSAGNEGSTKGVQAMYDNGLVIGAVQFYGNKKTDIRNASYSGRTMGALKVDYVGFMYDWTGTSAATPFVAGQIALFISRFGKVSQSEFQKLIKPYCMDLGDTDKDWTYGDGLIVLPDENIKKKGEEKMTTANDIIKKAVSQIGVKENPSGSNNVKYNTEYYGRAVSGSDYPWCCAFIWWVFKECGASGLFYGGEKTAYCPAVESYYKSTGQWYASNPQAGDLVLFDFDKSGTAEHIGILEKINSDGTYCVIEGNTSVTSNDNGGCVMRRTRYKSQIKGFARPEYSKEDALKSVESINDIVWELSNAGIITDGKLWIKKCEEDINVYWLCRKMANKLRGTL